MADDVTKQDLLDLERRLNDRLEQVEERLWSALHGSARSMDIRVRSLSAVTSGIDERLSLLEERISALERRKNL